MKIISLCDIPIEQLRVQFRSAMKYIPRIPENNIPGRRCSSLMYILEGEYEYSWDGGSLLAGAGDLVCSPAGSSYRYRIRTEHAEVIQVEFDLLLDEQITICDHPFAKPCSVEPVLSDILRHAAACDRYRLMSSMYLLLSRMADSDSPAISPRIQPAVDYISANYTRPIPVGELAKLCFISESQLRRLFNSELGMTPTQYRNSLLIRSARELLSGGSGTVGEVASVLGFENIYSFSHFFKRETGISPRDLIR